MTDSSPDFHTTLKLILIAVAAWSCFVLTDTISKWLAQDFPVPQIIWISSLVGALVTGGLIVRTHGLRGLIPDNRKWHLVRTISVSATAFLVVSALAHIPLADFYGIVFLSPLVIALFAHIFLGEKAGLHRMIAIVVGFCGVLVLAGPQFHTFNVGLLFAFGAMIAISINALVMRKIRDEPVLLRLAFYPLILNTIIHLPLMAMDPNTAWPDTGSWLLLILITPLMLAALVGHSYAFAKAPEAAIIAPFHYTQMILGVILGFILFGDIPSTATITGSGIIIVAGLYMIWREHIHHRNLLRNLQR